MKVSFQEKEESLLMKTEGHDRVYDYFPAELKEEMKRLLECELGLPEEIRVRIGQTVKIKIAGEEREVGKRVLSQEQFSALIQRFNRSSVYAWEEEYKQGYLTLPGGHRVGLAGKVILQNSKVRMIRDITSINIRFARNVYGAAEGLKEYVLADNRLQDVLLIGPPGSGKTTVLREMVRLCSDGIWGKGYNVSLVDERSEIAGSVKGIPQLDIGSRTDVLDGCHKAYGMMWMLRSMAPDILAVDELATKEDVQGVQQAIGCGVAVFATAHGYTLKEVQKRKNLQILLAGGYFSRLIFLDKGRGKERIKAIYTYQDKYERVR